MAFNSANAVEKGIKALFATGIQADFKPLFDPMINYYTSESASEKIYISGAVPGFKEWSGQMATADYKDYLYEIVNKHYAMAIPVNRDTLDDSKKYLGPTVETKVAELIQVYSNFQDSLGQALLDANGNAFDGSAFFATSRTFDTGSNTIKNLATGTLSTAYTTATFTADFQSAFNALAGFFDKNGNPYNANLDLVAFVPAQHYAVAKKVLEGEMGGLVYTSGTETANWRGAAKVILNPRQVQTNNDWYLVNLAAVQKPFMGTKRAPVRWNMKDDPECTDIKYIADFRMGLGYHNPMSIVKINN